MAWVWTDDLLQRVIAAGGSVPEPARRWIHAPIALRVDDEQSQQVAHLLEIEELSTVPGLARTMSSPSCGCVASPADPLIGDLGAAG